MNGFEWDAGHIIFLGIFYAVVMVVLATVIRSLLRAKRHFRLQQAETIRWKEDFHDLPPCDRRCRHELNGEVKSRICENCFDCRYCDRHAEFESAAAAQGIKPRDERLGFPLPLDRLYHRGHTWVRQEDDGTLTVGLDELGARLIGRAECVSLPPVGARVQTNGTGWTVRRNGSTVRVLAPVDGTVLATGGPDQGWYLKLRPAPAASNMRHLLRGTEVSRWMAGEIERLQLLAGDDMHPALADGGTPIADIGAVLPGSDWENVCGQMLLQP